MTSLATPTPDHAAAPPPVHDVFLSVMPVIVARARWRFAATDPTLLHLPRRPPGVGGAYCACTPQPCLRVEHSGRSETWLFGAGGGGRHRDANRPAAGTADQRCTGTEVRRARSSPA